MAYYKKTSSVERANILDSEVGLTLKTFEVENTLANSEGIIVAGTPYPTNDATIKGFIFEDVNMNGDTKRPVSVVVAGRIKEANLPVTVASTAKTTLAKLDIYLV